MNINTQPNEQTIIKSVKDTTVTPQTGGGTGLPDKPIRTEKSQESATVTISKDAQDLLNSEVKPLTGGGTGLPDKPVRT
jgi:hypothetical protein